MTIASAKEVIDFWFKEGHDEYWFTQNADFDAEIRAKFYDTWERGRQGLLFEWRETFEGLLAEIIVLDQFSRNLQRGSQLSYSQDGMALVLAQYAIKHPDFKKQAVNQKSFAILPFMHSESKEMHQITEKLYMELESETHTKSMKEHKKIIDTFGRYPYRNEVMGRESTPEELDFINGNDLSFTKT